MEPFDDAQEPVNLLLAFCVLGLGLPESRHQAGIRSQVPARHGVPITLDGDGQHYPEDLPAFFEMAEKHPDAMLIGSRNLRMENMPGGNTFANKFSNFWFKVQTGVSLPDTQSGFRLYQLDKLGSLWYLTSRYEAELEMLVAQCWKRVEMVPVPIDVYYPPAGERVTHFRPFWDFFRISILNTILCILALLYGYPSKLLRKL